jgi:hypothetical protein
VGSRLRTFYAWSDLRRRPERLFGPFAAVWLLVNVAPWGFGTHYLDSFYLAFTLQLTNVILPYTYAFAVICFLALLYAGLRWAQLEFWRTFLIAGTVPFAGPGAFEIVFQEAGKYVLPYIFVGYAVPYVMFSYGTWVLLGLTGLAWWRITWRWWIALAYSIGGFLLWIELGFALPATGTFAQLPVAYLLNITLKGSFYLVFFLPVFEGMLFAHRSRALAATDRPSSQRMSTEGVRTSPSHEGPAPEACTITPRTP